MCTSSEANELQAVFDEAHRGDTIRLQAGRTWERSGNHFVLTTRPGTSGYLTVTTTEEAKLPLSGTRITRAYNSLLPTLQTRATNKAALALAGTDSPATHIKLRGIRFTVAPNATRTTSFSRGPLLIGWASVDDFDGFVLNDPSQLPDQIIVQHCVFEQDWVHQVSRMIRLHGRHVEIRDSFIEGGQALGADAQGISGSNTKGPYIIENNYIDGTSENLIFGGSKPNFDDELDSGLIRFNYFPHVRERHQYVKWSPGLMVFKGRIIQPSNGAANSLIAMTSGTTGNTEPGWPTTTGAQVNDNGIIWERIGSSGKWVVKNNFELKTGKNILIQYNVFDGMWLDGQETAINIKAENQNDAHTLCDASEGWPACYGARTTGIKFLNNIVRDWPAALKLVGGTFGIPAQVGNYEVRNNLFDQAGASWPGFRTLSILGTSPVATPNVSTVGMDDVIVENNTFITSTPNAMAISLSATPFGGKTRIRNNIFSRGTSGVKASGVAEGRATLQATICNGQPCTPSQWDKNVIAGAPLALYPAGTMNICSNSLACAGDLDFEQPQNGKLFRGLSTKQYVVRDGHQAKRGGAGGSDVGADFATLPEIRNLQVQTTATTALLSYYVTGPIAHIPCVVEVSTAEDLSTIVPDLNPAQYERPDTDRNPRSIVSDNSRMILIGSNVPLQPQTQYWYRLQCGGDVRRGSFTTTTESLAAGLSQLFLQRNKTRSQTAHSLVEYAFSYNQSSGLVNPLSTNPVACASSCEISLEVPKGATVYYRWKELNASDAVTHTTQIHATVVP
jgi:hypothetical protein